MTIRKSLNKEFIIFIFMLAVLVALVIGDGYPNAVTNGLRLWIATIIPSMFPYFFVCAMLASLNLTSKISLKLSPITNKLFNTSGVVGYAFLMSILSGYPMGAKIVSDLRNSNLISHTESQRASVFCSCSSPLFMIGTVGGLLFNNPIFGICLTAVHILSLFIVGIIFGFYKRSDGITKRVYKKELKTDSIFYDSVFSSINSTLLVGGIITVFYVFIELLLQNGILNPAIFVTEKLVGDKNLASGFVIGIFESTRGLTKMATGSFCFFSLPLCAFISGFGGLSVIMQSVTFLKSAKIKTAPFYVGKIMHAVISFLLAIPLSLFVF